MTVAGAPMRDDLSATDLVLCARNGDQRAWDALVERYAPLVWSICRRYRLDRADAEDVGQTVWLSLVDQLDKLREPTALPGWLSTTTRRACLQVLGAARRSGTPGPVTGPEDLPDPRAATAEQELLAAERRVALREALTSLPPHCQQLLVLLIQDPPVSYAEISARLGISIGSIGPTRSRCLDKLRRHPAIVALISAEADSGRRPGRSRQPIMGTRLPSPHHVQGIDHVGHAADLPVISRRGWDVSTSSKPPPPT